MQLSKNGFRFKTALVLCATFRGFNMKKLCVIFMLCASPAFAIDFTQPLKMADGEMAQDCAHFTDTKCDKVVTLTLGRLIAAALSQPKKGDIVGQVQDGKLAMRVLDAKNETLTPEEITRIKERLGEMGINAVVVLNAVRAIDPTVDKK